MENKTSLEIMPVLGLAFAKELKLVLDRFIDKRVLILAPSAAGKSTTVEALKTFGVDAKDMDKELFPRFSRHEKDFALKTRPPTDPETGGYAVDVPSEKIKRVQSEYDPNNPASAEMWYQGNLALRHFLNERVKVEPGKPFISALAGLFGSYSL